LEGAAAKAFKDVAGAMDDQKFAVTSEAALFTEYEVKTDDAVILFKKFDEGRNDLTDAESLTNTEELTKFVAANALPLVVEFNHETGNFKFTVFTLRKCCII
jgi:protein disulfide-isomerase A1